jgi:uncharacterized membrane protein
MSETMVTKRRPGVRRVVEGLVSRPILTSAAGVGLFAGALLAFIPNPLSLSTRSILAWDAGCLWFVVLMVHIMGDKRAVDIERHAARQDEGRHFILGLVLIAAIASLSAVAAELTIAKNVHGLDKSAHIGLAFVTVALSWVLVQMIFALHYAHEYYLPAEDGPGCRKGLAFLDHAPPDYWDFLHFAVVIGVASQTADIAFTSKPMRRIGTVHGVISFCFNTIVLALTINLLAGLF